MNGLGTRKAFGLGPEGPSPFQDVQPTGRAMANGYRQEIIDGFEAERPRYNPVSRLPPEPVEEDAREAQTIKDREILTASSVF